MDPDVAEMRERAAQVAESFAEDAEATMASNPHSYEIRERYRELATQAWRIAEEIRSLGYVNGTGGGSA